MSQSTVQSGSQSGSQSGRRPRPFDWRHNPGFGIFTALVMLFLYFPLAILVIFSFNANRYVTG